MHKGVSGQKMLIIFWCSVLFEGILSGLELWTPWKRCFETVFISCVMTTWKPLVNYLIKQCETLLVCVDVNLSILWYLEPQRQTKLFSYALLQCWICEEKHLVSKKVLQLTSALQMYAGQLILKGWRRPEDISFTRHPSRSQRPVHIISEFAVYRLLEHVMMRLTCTNRKHSVLDKHYFWNHIACEKQTYTFSILHIVQQLVVSVHTGCIPQSSETKEVAIVAVCWMQNVELDSKFSYNLFMRIQTSELSGLSLGWGFSLCIFGNCYLLSSPKTF